MTRLQRLSPVLLSALMMACSEAQPYVQAPAPLAASQAVVDAGLGDRTATLNLKAAAYALLATGSPSPNTVHRWVGADLVRYDVELRVRNATTATQFDAVGGGITAEVPVGGTGTGTATFNRLRQGAYYRAYVKAMGRKDGASGSATIQQMNTQAQNDHVDFDFTATNDVASEVNRTLSVSFDNVAFSGTGALGFGSPVPGAYMSPSAAPGVVVINPPSASPSPSPSPSPSATPNVSTFGVPGLSPRQVAFDAQGNAWLSNSGSAFVTKLSSSGSVLGHFTVGSGSSGMAVDSQGQVWVAYLSTGAVTKLASNGSVLGTFSVGSTPRDVVADASGNLWVANHSGSNVIKLGSNGSVLGTFAVGSLPIGLDVDAQGNLWVTNSNGASVTKLASNGSALGTFGVGSSPYDVAIDANGQAWVANYSSNNVTLLASNGSVLGTYTVGSNPHSIDTDALGQVWVANQISSNVTKLASQGGLLATITVGSGPRGLTVSGNGVVWVVNATAQSITLIR